MITQNIIYCNIWNRRAVGYRQLWGEGPGHHLRGGFHIGPSTRRGLECLFHVGWRRSRNNSDLFVPCVSVNVQVGITSSHVTCFVVHSHFVLPVRYKHSLVPRPTARPPTGPTQTHALCVFWADPCAAAAGQCTLRRRTLNKNSSSVAVWRDIRFLRKVSLVTQQQCARSSGCDVWTQQRRVHVVPAEAAASGGSQKTEPEKTWCTNHTLWILMSNL